MKSLFEMNAEMEQLLSMLCDEETGEINEEVYKQIIQLEIDRNEKIDGWCFWLKQKKAELDAAKEVLDRAKNRYLAMEESLRNARATFTKLMDGEKFKSAYNTVYYTRTEAVVPDADFDYTKVDDDFLVYRTPDINKAKVKSALRLGIYVPGLHLEEHNTMVIR